MRGALCGMRARGVCCLACKPCQALQLRTARLLLCANVRSLAMRGDACATGDEWCQALQLRGARLLLCERRILALRGDACATGDAWCQTIRPGRSQARTAPIWWPPGMARPAQALQLRCRLPSDSTSWPETCPARLAVVLGHSSKLSSTQELQLSAACQWELAAGRKAPRCACCTGRALI